ncbi:hypothetical protein HW555_008039, partial [Spodoptera exigua]
SFWDERWWLPRGVKWADVTNGPDKTVLYPDISDFYYVIPLTIGLLVLRYTLNICCFTTLGLALGIRKKKKRNLRLIPALETAYKKNTLIKDNTALAKQLDMSERQVERWWRLRRNQDKPSNLTKFCEHAWKTVYLSFSTSTSLYILWDKDWFWDLDKCFIDFGKHELSMDVYWFYLTTMAFIVSLSVTFFHDVKRKDFMEMLVHHIVAIFLLSLSWITTAFRIGIILIPLLDSTEALLEFVKAIKRANFEKMATILFVGFVPVWFYTRLYLFPLYLYSSSVRAMTFLGHFYSIYFVNALLFILFFLCMYWTVLVVKVILNTITSGNYFGMSAGGFLRGVKWADVTNGPDKTVLYPDISDFYYVIPLTIGLLVLRYTLNMYCFTPLGLALGIPNKKKRNLRPIPALETAYRKNALIKDTTALAKQLDMSERQVERWWRLRRNQDKTSSLTKFCEHAWKVFYLSFSTPAVFYIVWDKDWFWDLDKCYINFGKHELTMDIYWFYMMTAAYMVSMTITYFHDVKRKDFWGMLAHHVVTILLLFISWNMNAFRIGLIIVVLLDPTEVCLEFVKALRRANFEKLATALFVGFVPLWFYTRLYLFPQYLYSTSIRSMVFWGPFFAVYVVNSLLFVLFILCVYWTILIVKVVFNTLSSGVPRDVRSSSSEVTDVDDVDKLLLSNSR